MSNSAFIKENINMEREPAPLVAKTPVQERGKRRFDAILHAAEELIIELGIDNVSPHKIAKRANIPPASVYQYFPSLGILFSTLSERHFVISFEILERMIAETNIRNWRDLANVLVETAYEFYTKDKISEILFLGAYQAPGVRGQTAARLTRLGIWNTEQFAIMYKKSDLDSLPEKLAICGDVMKAVYFRSISLYGEIRPEYKEEARVLVIEYLGEFFKSFGE